MLKTGSNSAYFRSFISVDNGGSSFNFDGLDSKAGVNFCAKLKDSYSEP